MIIQNLTLEGKKFPHIFIATILTKHFLNSQYLENINFSNCTKFLNMNITFMI